MTIRNFVVVYDYETGSLNPYKCQPLQLASVIVNIQKLEIVENSEFQSLIRPELDVEKCKSLDIDQIDERALEVNKLSLDELKNAPVPSIVWNNFVEYLKNYNLKGRNGNKWDAPIRAGYNNSNYDDYICSVMCEKFGPKLDQGQMTIFHPFFNFDVQILVASLFGHQRLDISESDDSVVKTNSISMDTMRKYFGYKIHNAHNAIVDVKQTADLLIRCLRLLRSLVDGKFPGGRIKFKNCVGGKI